MVRAKETYLKQEDKFNLDRAFYSESEEEEEDDDEDKKDSENDNGGEDIDLRSRLNSEKVTIWTRNNVINIFSNRLFVNESGLVGV